ncbi:MAG TPA: hypothetical protein VG963_30650 [Polyangiaceae bacterium]|nr:hypothetical protein [Polyangiaceae bacterium]
MKSTLRALLFFAALVASSMHSRDAHAYAWMIRHGFAECGGCHVDPMGGETLTGMGRVMGQTLLASGYGEKTPSNVAMFLFGVQEPDAVRLGGSFRLMDIYDFKTTEPTLFPMQTDFYGAVSAGRFVLGASIGISRASDRYEYTDKARLFGSVDDRGYVAVSRNHWLGYKFTDDLMVRLGRMNLPFGLRIPEHIMWVRHETDTDRESDQEHGLSVVYSSGRFRGELMGFIGNLQIPKQYLSPGYSGYLEYSLDTNLAVGVSSLVSYAKRLPFTTDETVTSAQRAVTRIVDGVTLRYAPWRELVFLGEADLQKLTGSGLGSVGMLQADLEPLQGLHLALTGEWLNRGTLHPEDITAGVTRVPVGPGRGDTRYGLWTTVNWFFFPHFDIRSDLVFRGGRDTVLQTQLHFYL